jgi:hypothetical protein
MPALALVTPTSAPYGTPCICVTILAYRCLATTRSFGTMLEPRYIFRAKTLDQ